MKKRWKYLGMSGVLILSSLGLSGCTKVTKESLLTKMAAKMVNTESYSAVMDMDMKLNLEASGFQMDMIIGGNFDMDVTTEPQAAYMNGTMNMEVIGQKMDMNMEMYSVQAGDDMEIYAKTNFMGVDTGWLKTSAKSSGMDVGGITDFMKNFQEESIKKLLDNVTLAEETVEIDGVECYVITGTETGDVIQPWIDYLGESMGDALDNDEAELLKSMDWSKINVPIELYIDKKETRPVKINMDLKETMNTMMSDVMTQAFATGNVPESFSFEMSFENCDVAMSFDSYGEVEAITVPEDVKSEAKESDDFGLEDEMEDLLGAESEESI